MSFNTQRTQRTNNIKTYIIGNISVKINITVSFFFFSNNIILLNNIVIQYKHITYSS